MASCLEGQRIEIDVTLEPGSIASSAHDAGQCESALGEYRVTVPSRTKRGFAPGSARAMATVVIREKGEVVDTQTWTRLVTLQP